MDPATLATLEDIRSSLHWLKVIAGSAAVLGLVLLSLIAWAALKRVRGRGFEMTAEQYFDEGKFRELIDYCNERLARRPNNLHALWYLGRGHFALAQYAEARVPFERLIAIEPGWEKGHVRPYLNKIDQASGKAS